VDVEGDHSAARIKQQGEIGKRENNSVAMGTSETARTLTACIEHQGDERQEGRATATRR
jgi:hypothetical protein